MQYAQVSLCRAAVCRGHPHSGSPSPLYRLGDASSCGSPSADVRMWNVERSRVAALPDRLFCSSFYLPELFDHRRADPARTCVANRIAMVLTTLQPEHTKLHIEMLKRR